MPSFRFSLAAILAGAAIAAVPTATHATSVKAEPCTDSSRSCKIATANTYLDALLSHDGSKIRLAPNARRTQNGSVTAENAEEIRTSLTSPTPDDVNTGIRDKRWFVAGEHVTAFFLLDTSTLPPSPLHTTTVHLVERFRVRRGLIHEIEAVYWVGPGPQEEGSGWPAPKDESYNAPPTVSPAQVPDRAGWCTKATTRCAVRAARSYLTALPTRDYRKTQLHERVRRTQNGDTTGLSANDVRRNGQDPHPDSVITGVRDLRWFVARQGNAFEVISFSLADTSTVPQTPVHTGTIHLANRFRVVKGLVTQIESIYWIAPGPTPEPSGWE
jgi:hypothetical protein